MGVNLAIRFTDQSTGRTSPHGWFGALSPTSLNIQARYYNPYLNQFLSRDPFPGYGKLPQTQNGFSYVNNNPINLTDPSGRDPDWCNFRYDIQDEVIDCYLRYLPTGPYRPSSRISPSFPTPTPIQAPTMPTALPTSTVLPTATPSVAGKIPDDSYSNINQFWDIPDSLKRLPDGTKLGSNACGLVAAANAVTELGGKTWGTNFQLILNNTTGYGTGYGIQPSYYLASLKAALSPEFNVFERRGWTISGIDNALRQEGHAVIVDIHVNNVTSRPDVPPIENLDGTYSHDTFAHFAQVLAVNPTDIYLDNSIGGGGNLNFWEVPHSLFLEAWYYPETRSTLPADRNNYTPEEVTNWGVEIVKRQN